MKKPLIITKKYPETDFNACIMTEEHISNDGDLIPIKALWDTGSSESVISSELVKKLNLHSIGNAIIGSTGATIKSNIYKLDFVLAGKQHILLDVTESSQLNDSGIDMLIVLDVICLGDFAISTYDGTVCFSFRYPSQGLIDFNAQ